MTSTPPAVKTLIKPSLEGFLNTPGEDWISRQRIVLSLTTPQPVSTPTPSTPPAVVTPMGNFTPPQHHPPPYAASSSSSSSFSSPPSQLSALQRGSGGFSGAMSLPRQPPPAPKKRAQHSRRLTWDPQPIPTSLMTDQASRKTIEQQLFQQYNVGAAGALGYYVDEFERLQNLGQSTFESDPHVVRCQCKRTKREYAIKILHDRAAAEAEVQALSAITPHSNVLQLYNAWEEQGVQYIQTELLMIDMATYLRTCVGKRPPESVIWSWLSGIVEGVRHIHSHKVLHLDLKPDNIFLRWRPSSPSVGVVRLASPPHKSTHVSMSPLGSPTLSPRVSSGNILSLSSSGDSFQITPPSSAASREYAMSTPPPLPTPPALMDGMRPYTPPNRRLSGNTWQSAVVSSSAWRPNPPTSTVNEWTVVIGDFGSAADVDNFESDIAGKADERYVAPERTASYAADVFAIGATIADILMDIEMPSGGPKWYELRSGSQPLKHLLVNRFNAPESLAQLVSDMMNPLPAARPKITDVIARIGLPHDQPQTPQQLHELQRRSTPPTLRTGHMFVAAIEETRKRERTPSPLTPAANPAIVAVAQVVTAPKPSPLVLPQQPQHQPPRPLLNLYNINTMASEEMPTEQSARSSPRSPLTLPQLSTPPPNPIARGGSAATTTTTSTTTTTTSNYNLRNRAASSVSRTVPQSPLHSPSTGQPRSPGPMPPPSAVPPRQSSKSSLSRKITFD